MRDYLWTAMFVVFWPAAILLAWWLTREPEVSQADIDRLAREVLTPAPTSGDRR